MTTVNLLNSVPTFVTTSGVVCLEIAFPYNNHTDYHIYEHTSFDDDDIPSKIAKKLASRKQYATMFYNDTLWVKVILYY